jgi:hypothetical protein
MDIRHKPLAGSMYNGGSYARCQHCHAVVMWAAVGDSATEWRSDGSSGGDECEALDLASARMEIFGESLSDALQQTGY